MSENQWDRLSQRQSRVPAQLPGGEATLGSSTGSNREDSDA
jgi:hypothetical protein